MPAWLQGNTCLYSPAFLPIKTEIHPFDICKYKGRNVRALIFWSLVWGRHITSAHGIIIIMCIFINKKVLNPEKPYNAMEMGGNQVWPKEGFLQFLGWRTLQISRSIRSFMIFNNVVVTCLPHPCAWQIKAHTIPPS